MKRRNFLKSGSAGAVAALAAPAVHSDSTFELRMILSWIKNSPGTGAAAQRLAERIELMSGGRIKIKIFGVGEIVGAFDVLDAVGNGVAELGHTASFFWQGKIPASALYTAAPFGLTAVEHMSWIYHDDGGALWDELYAPLGVKPLLASNTSVGMGGWFKKEIRSLDDIAGLKYRMPGLGGDVMRRLGAVPVSIAPPEIANSLQSGVVDAAEWLGPWADLAKGFYKFAPYYYGPGFHEPNGAAELLVNADIWSALPDDLRAVIDNACIAEHAYSLAQIEWANPTALAKLEAQHGVHVRVFPDSILGAARKAVDDVFDDLAQKDEITARIVGSYRSARDRSVDWSNSSLLPFLKARASSPVS